MVYITPSDICPECREAGRTVCPHRHCQAESNPATRPQTRSFDLTPTASASLLKLGVLGALGALSYYLYCSTRLQTEAREVENDAESEAEAEVSFDEWEPNE